MVVSRGNDRFVVGGPGGTVSPKALLWDAKLRQATGRCIELHECYYPRMRSEDTGYSAEVARKLVGISYRQLDYWDKTNLLRPSVNQARGAFTLSKTWLSCGLSPG